MRKLTREGRIVIFKSFALSNIVFQSLINVIPNHIMSELISIQKNLYGKTQIQ